MEESGKDTPIPLPNVSSKILAKVRPQFAFSRSHFPIPRKLRGRQHLPLVQIRSDHFGAGATPFSNESLGLLGYLWGRRIHQAGIVWRSFTLQVIEYSKYHVDSSKKSDGEEKPAKSEEEVKIWDTEFVKVDQGTLFELILVCRHAFLFWCPFASQCGLSVDALRMRVRES